MQYQDYKVAEGIPRLNNVTGYNLTCIISLSIKFFQHSQTMNPWNYYPDVQQRCFLEGEHDVHSRDSTKNLADRFSDLNPLLILINTTGCMSLIGRTDVQFLSQTQKLLQTVELAYMLPHSNLYTPLREAA